MGGRRIAGLGLALVAAVGIAGSLLGAPAAGDDGQPVQEAQSAELAWGACPPDLVVTTPLECATIPVPLDYDRPEGAQIEIMISRLASTNPAARQGVLLTNPGGPGYAGLSMPADLATRGIPSSVLDAYDVIGIDTRGVGHSAPVSCGFTADQDYRGNVPPYAPDEAAVTEQAKASKLIADQCAANDPENRMRHMTTANAARDMDRIRQALDEKKISFFGTSYGSGLGAAYTSLFPEQSDRVIVDSNLGGTSLDRGAHRRFGLGLEDRFPDFAMWAAQRHASYELGRTPREVRAGFLALADQLDREPIAGIDGATFRYFMFFSSYHDDGFTMIAPLWQSLANDDARAAHRLAGALEPATAVVPGASASTDTTTGGKVPSPTDNSWSAYLAFSCNDTDWPEDVATYQRDVAVDRKRYPLYGAATANINPCAYWHNDPVDPPLEINDQGPRNVLVLQHLRDPGTPHLGGEMARAAFGERARLVSVDDGGHGVYVFGSNACAQNTATTYLLTGDLPRTDTFCRADR